MKKGSRRKANNHRNRPLATPKGVKRKGHKNPLWGKMDQSAMRAVVNQAIGSALVAALDIDFVGMLEKMPDLPETETETETIQ